MNGDLMGAAARAMTHPDFYRVSLKNWVTPWTNVDRTAVAPLNDYTATVIGMIRDDVPFNEVLTSDLVYVGQNVANLPAYSHTDNQHYEFLENNAVDLSDPNLFAGVTQSGLPNSVLFDTETAGVTTTRAAGEAYFSAGTNRRMWRYTSLNYLCRDLEDMRDNTRPADRIRQDVSRSPGQPALPQRVLVVSRRPGPPRGRLRLLRLRHEPGSRGLHAGNGAAQDGAERQYLALRLRNRSMIAGTTSGARGPTSSSTGGVPRSVVSG